PGHHAHVELAGPGGSLGIPSLGAQKIPRVRVRGPKGPLKDMLQSQSDELRKAGNTKIREAMEIMGQHNLDAGKGGDKLSASEIARIARTALRIAGVPVTAQHISNLVWLALKESGGDPDIFNMSDINAQQGNPSGGLMQMIKTTFDAHKLPGYENWLN